MTEWMYFFLVFLILTLIGALLLNYLNKCPHSWTLIKEYQTFRAKDDKLVGGGKVYECYHCKTIKKEEFTL